MSVITTGNFTKALWPGVNKWYGKAYDEFPKEYTDLFEVFNSTKAFEEDVGVTSFGLLIKKPEGAAVEYDTEKQAFITRYAHTAFALGFIVTEEAFDDDQYMVIGEKKAKGLAFSVNQTIETLGANVYNRAFNTAFLGGDGATLVASAGGGGSTSHPNYAGGTWTNGPSTAADLSEASLEQACIDIMRFTNDRGLKIQAIPQSLHIAPDNVFEADRILNSSGRVGTNNNDLNSLKNMGKFPKGVFVNHYFTDPDAWFIRTNIPDGMKWFWRKQPVFSTDNDWDTNNAKYKTVLRSTAGWTDPRGIYGSPGA
jgi:hypothetical protein